jgi:hypothetical protein
MKRTSVSVSIVALFLLAIILPACAPEPGLVPDVYLAPDGNDSRNCLTAGTACETFGRVLALVQRGGTIHLAAGNYQPDQGVIEKLLTVEGAGRDSTTLYTTSSRGPSIFEVRSGGWLLLRDVTLSGQRVTGSVNYGILQRDGTLVSVSDCIIKNFSVPSSEGISNDGGMLLVENTRFLNNHAGVINSNLHGARSQVSSSVFNGNVNGFINQADGYAMIDDDTQFVGNDDAVSNNGILRIRDTRFSGSTGRSISNSGTLLLLDRVDISSSQSWGIITSAGRVAVRSSTLHENLDTAITVIGGDLEVTRSVIRDNNGSGISLGTSPDNGEEIMLTVTQTAIVRNQENGILNGAAAGVIGLSNVTISRNNLAETSSGGISLPRGGSLTVEDSTIVRNQGVGIWANGPAVVVTRRSVVAVNTGSECVGGSFTVDLPTYACAEGLTLASLSMGGLSNEGGTIVHPLLDGSPLIDTAAPGCPGVDQRDAPRPTGGGCDIGAYEYQFALTADEGTGGIIPLPTQTPESQPKPRLTFTTDTNCRKGPGTRYNVLSQVAAGTMLEAQGRSADNAWWYVVPGQAAQGCWVGDSTVDKQGSPEGATVMTGPALPDPPEGFDAKQACDTKAKTHIVKLNWIGQAGATGYRIYRDGKLVSAPGANASSYNDNAPFGGAGLLYEIESLNEDGASIRVPLSVPPCG